MSNSTNQFCPASRAMLVGAMVGGGASIVTQWKAYKEGDIAVNDVVTKAAKSAVQAAAIGGVTTYVAEKIAGRSALSLMTILAAGAASLYLIDQYSGKKNHE